MPNSTPSSYAVTWGHEFISDGARQRVVDIELDPAALTDRTFMEVLKTLTGYDGKSWRSVYPVRLAGAVYVLHAFQKKSKKGVATTKHDLDLIKDRLKDAREHHAERIKQQGEKGNRNG